MAELIIPTFPGALKPLWPPTESLLSGPWNPKKRYGHRVKLLWSPKNLMATESFALEHEKRYGHRLALPELEKRYGHRVLCSGTQETLWPSTQIAPEPENRFGHQLNRS